MHSCKLVDGEGSALGISMRTKIKENTIPLGYWHAVQLEESLEARERAENEAREQLTQPRYNFIVFLMNV